MCFGCLFLAHLRHIHSRTKACRNIYFDATYTWLLWFFLNSLWYNLQTVGIFQSLKEMLCRWNGKHRGTLNSLCCCTELRMSAPRRINSTGIRSSLDFCWVWCWCRYVCSLLLHSHISGLKKRFDSFPVEESIAPLDSTSRSSVDYTGSRQMVAVTIRSWSQAAWMWRKVPVVCALFQARS